MTGGPAPAETAIAQASWPPPASAAITALIKDPSATYKLPVTKYAFEDMTVKKIRIDGNGQILHINRIRLIAFNGANMNSTAVVTASSYASLADKPENVLSSDPKVSHFHSAGYTNEWIELTLNPPIKLDRVEIDNRIDCCQDRLAAFRLRVTDTLGNEFFNQGLSSAAKQVYGMPGYKFPANCTPVGGRDLRCTSANCDPGDVKVDANTCVKQSAIAAAPPLKGAEGFQGGPARAWDPLTVAPRPASSAGPIAPPVQELRALQTHAFGRDSARNMATQRFDLGDMYSLPLRGGAAAAPLTPFETAMRNQSVGMTAAPLYKKPAQVGLAAAANENPKEAVQQRAAYKYLRFRPVRTREATAEAVAVGRMSFFYEGSEIAVNQATATNPMGDWTGRAADVAGPNARAGFRDVYKKALVLAFPQPILVDGFSFTTARGARSAAEDPVAWKLEGSYNGTFWQVLHDQPAAFPVPTKRGEDLPLFKF